MHNYENIQDIYTLSPLQEGLFYHYLQDSESRSYFEQLSYRLSGLLNISVVEKSVQQLFDRHDVLRTQFFNDKADVMLQVVLKQVKADFYFEDLRGKEVLEEKLAQIECHKQQDKERAFNLQKDLLMRVAILQLSDEEYELIWSHHHIIADGWCVGVLIREFFELYQSLIEDRPHRLPPVTPYRKYIEWLEKQDKTGANAYWENYLKGYKELAGIPRTALSDVKDYDRCEQYGYFDEKTYERLRSYAEKHQVTLNAVFRGIWGIVLSKYTGRDDVVYGTVVSSRPPEIEGVQQMIGLFINANPVRVRFDATTYFHELAKSLHADMGESQKHAHYPMADIQEKTPLRSNLVDHLYGFQNYQQPSEIDLNANPSDEGKPPLFNIQNTTTYEQTNYDLNIKILPLSRLAVQIEFNANAYRQQFIKTLISQVLSVAEQIVSTDEIMVSEISFSLSDSDLHDFYKNYNQNQTAYPRDKNLVQLFSESVKAFPDKTALVHNGESLTYDQLDRISNRVAHFIRKQEIASEGTVAILMHPSVNLIAAILGVLKAGATYLPVNTEYPQERIRYMLQDTGSKLVISESAFIRELNELQWECKELEAFICVDSEDVYQEKEARGALMDRELWEYIGTSADDDISGGGWVDSYKGEKFTRQEMDEYGDNALKKLKPYLDKSKKVLEIGCASGITMFRIAPHVGEYYGTDLSQTIIDVNQEICKEKGMDNIRLYCLEAENIVELRERDFDIIIINSVVQCFSGYNYLRNMIENLISMLSDEGIIFLGDLYDHAKKEALIDSMKAYKKETRNFKTKVDFSNELFVSKDFLNDLEHDFTEIVNIDHSDKIASINNEMTAFHYDSIFYIDKKQAGTHSAMKRKYQYDATALKEQSEASLNVSIDPKQISNIIYTSGSTGNPKGVMIPHQGIVRLVKDTNFMSVQPEDCWAQNVNVSFDPSTLEIFGALLNGATLSITDKNILLDIDHFEKYILRYKISMMVLITPVFHEFANLKPAVFTSLKTLIVGGEALNAKQVKKVKDACPQLQIINAYGPTENAVISTTYEATGTESIIPIGKPMSNSEVYILNEKVEPLPVGMVGELGVAGDGLARGYLNAQTLTSTRFVRHPVKEKDRLYRTGDLARLREDGYVEFIGRIDNQVKIRGYRIELEEIEKMLLTIPQVAATVVTVIDAGELGKQLCAFVQLLEDIKDEEFADLIAIDLPKYMIPDYFVRLEKFPLTANGKIDRAALPIPEELKHKITENYVPPTNEVEETLVEIWSGILGRNTIGIDDNFFKLGGHSLKATQLISKIYREMKVKIELSEVFASPTIREIAGKIMRQGDEDYMRIEPIKEREYYDISHAQKRLWILNELEEQQTSYNSSSAYILEGIDPEIFEKALNTIIERHETLRTTFINIGGVPYQKIHATEGFNFNLTHLDLSEDVDGEEKAEKLAHEQGIQPFDLSKGPLIRAMLVKLMEDKWLFAFTMHHIICDGWSMQVLTGELDKVYNAYKGGQPSPLRELHIQYKDFVHWQNGIINEREEKYWLDKLSGTTGSIALPFDFEKTAHNTFEGKNVISYIDLEVTNQLKNLAIEHDTSLSTVVFTIFNILLYNISGQQDLLVGVAIANRNHPDLENLVGFFVNILPIRSYVDENSEFEETLRRNAEAMVTAFDHQNYPFDLIVEKLNPERVGNVQPLFNVLYGFQNFTDLFIDFEGTVKTDDSIKAKGLEQDFETSKFDLTLFVYEYENGLQLVFEYNSSLFKKSTVKEWMEYFKGFLEHACQATENI